MVAAVSRTERSTDVAQIAAWPRLRLVPNVVANHDGLDAIATSGQVAPVPFLTVHVVLAGAIEGAAAIGATLATPWLAPILEMGSAALVACVAADAARRVVMRGRSKSANAHADLATRRVLSASLKSMNARDRGCVAGRTLDLALNRKSFRKVARATGAVVSSCARATVSGFASTALTAHAPHLIAASRVLSVSRAMWRGASFVRAIENGAHAHCRAVARDHM
jgi:hypothetical protein